MDETATLHFCFGHLAPNQPFTLQVGANRYPLSPHTPQSLGQACQGNTALACLPNAATHFSHSVRVPGDGPALLRVTGPKLAANEPLDRLILTSIHIPRRHREAGLARRRTAGAAPSMAKLAFLGGPSVPPADELILDLSSLVSAFDAAQSLVFHHPELMTLMAEPAETILEIVYNAPGLIFLAQSMLQESTNHEQDPTQPNWVTSQPGTHWQTGQPSGPIYVWSDQTVEYMKQPLQDVLRRAKNDVKLQGQCWTVRPGITQVPLEPKTSVAGKGAKADAAEANYIVKELTPQSGVTHSFSYDPSNSTASIILTNDYLRWLQVSVEQYGPNKEPIGAKSTIGELSPVDTIMAIPLPAQPSTYSFVFDEKASSATISMGGIGQVPFHWALDGNGIILTAVFNYGIPTLFIALGVAADQGGSKWKDLTQKIVGKVLTVLETAAEGPIGGAVTGGLSLEDVLAAVANCAGSMLLDAIAGSDALKAYVTAAISESAAEDAEPFIGWVARAIGSLADVASMIETSVEVARSPATMALSVVRSMDVTVTVTPDPAHEGQWPATATHYVITITYDDGPTYTYAGQMSPTTQESPIAHSFGNLPAGGSLTVLACFYSANDWLAGQGKTASMAAQPNQGGTLVIPPFAIKENLVPLSATTTYNFKEKLGFSGGARVWLPASSGPPTATAAILNNSNIGNNLWQLGALSLNEPLSALGYLWTASGQDVPLVGTGDQPYTGQLSTFQSIGDGAAPQSTLKFSGDGYIARPCLAFPPPTAVNPTADGFLLEPDLAGGSMLLRALSLATGEPFIASRQQSFGRFTGSLDDLALHPVGYAVALGIVTCTIQVLKVGDLAPDASAPAASIYAGQGTRPGLLLNPVAITCSLDKILVLQATADYPQGCIAAFDFKGNPVNCFPSGQSTSPLHPETGASVVLLDVSVEPKGYLFVLKYLTSATGPVLPSDYRLDIYAPDGSLLTQVPGLAAARLQVDLWRNLFTLNYEIVQGSGRTEPSVAQWIPSTPAPT